MFCDFDIIFVIVFAAFRILNDNDNCVTLEALDICV